MKINLKHIALTKDAYLQWVSIVDSVMPTLLSSGVQPRHIPNEKGEKLEDGRLLIYCDVKGFGRIELAVPAREWTWTDGRN